MALEQAKLHADRVVQFIKVHMGDPWRKEIGGHFHTPESISALVLGQLVREAVPQIGPVSSAVITVPAYFTEKRRRATQQAGEIAGLKVVGTLNEPMAAALAYGLHHTENEQIVAIYDLGGGTFDVTVVRTSPNEIEELATCGNRRLGGRDWDQVLVDYVADDFRRAHGVELRDDVQAMQDLLLECERAKRRLGQMQKTAIRVQSHGRDRTLEITRGQFERMTAHLLQSTRLTSETAVADAQLGWDRISRVLLVGGSTQMPAVREMVHRLSGKPPDTGINPVLAVALGAAMYGYLLETGRGLRAIPRPAGQDAEAELPGYELGIEEPETKSRPVMPVVRFVTAHGVGLKIRAGSEWSNKVLIPKNTRVPANITQRFRTRATGSRGQQIKIDITQGDTEDPSVAELLGTGKIEGLPPNEPEGRPVDVSMQFDDQGRLRVRAVYVLTGQQMQMSVDIPGGLRSEEVAEHHKYLKETGFLPPIDARELIRAMDERVVGSLDDTEDYEQVHTVDELFQALGINPEQREQSPKPPTPSKSGTVGDDDLPLLEPVD
jgi:molecular chaperone DnaK